MISRRYAQMDPATLDAQFAQTYRAHAEDEARHVQLDWHLLDRFYQGRPFWLRRVNATMLHGFIVGFFLKPRRANIRLIQLLIEEFPELQSMRHSLIRAVGDLATNAGYRRMMYSPDSTPIAWALFDRLPEFASLRRRLSMEGNR